MRWAFDCFAVCRRDSQSAVVAFGVASEAASEVASAVAVDAVAVAVARVVDQKDSR